MSGFDPRPACSQTMQVYRMIAGELSTAEAEALRAHVNECAQCRQAKSELEGAQAEVRRALPIERVSRDAQRAQEQRRPRWAARTAAAAAALTATIAAFVLVESTGVRAKGGLDAELIVVRKGEQLRGVTSFCAGDRLQPVLRSPRAGFAHVFWIGAEGARLLDPPAAIAAGRELVYPKSFELDDAPDTEQLLVAVGDRPEPELSAASEGALVVSWPINKRCEAVE